MTQGVPLTKELRRLIRAAIDAHQRRRRQAFIDAGELEACAGCGGDLDNATIGCKSCWDRQRRRARRGDPEFNANERELQRRCRAARRIGSPSRPAGSSETVTSLSKRPVGRTPLPLQLVSAGNRQRED